MRINYNVSAMLANNTLSNSNDALSKSIQRLSSGLKINNAKDNPSGLAIAKRMNGQIVGTGVAKLNSNDGISVIETADGALSEVHAMLQRMTELATNAKNGTNTEEDRKIIQDEIDELTKEIDRVSKTTLFNGQNILDGSFDYKAYCSTGPGAPSVRVSTINQEVAPGLYTIGGINWTADPASGDMTVVLSGLGGDFPGADFSEYSVRMIDNYVTMSHSSGMSMTLEIDEKLVFDGNLPKSGSVSGIEITATGIGPMRIQVGADEGHVVSMEIPAVTTGNLGISHLSVETPEKAGSALDRLKYATQYVSSVRGKLGAYQNRLEANNEYLGVLEENMTSAFSRVMDLDMAEEMTQYSTHNVIVQAGTSILAQANERPSQVLQLLQ